MLVVPDRCGSLANPSEGAGRESNKRHQAKQRESRRAEASPQNRQPKPVLAKKLAASGVTPQPTRRPSSRLGVKL